MPLGAARLTLLAFQATVEVEAEVIRKKIGIGAVNGAQIDTAQSQFGGASAVFNGTTDWLKINKSSNLDLSGDFTLECWFRSTDVVSNRKIFDWRGIDPTTWNGDGILNLSDTILMDQSGSAVRVFLDGANRASGSTSISNNVWYHFALSRSSGNCYAYLNGAEIVSGYANSNDFSLDTLSQSIGGSVYQTGAQFFQGNIDEVRISNTARYTTGFTPSTEPFINDANTTLLLHMNGTDGSTFFEDDNGVDRSPVGVSAIGNAQIDTAQSVFGGSSLMLDSTSDTVTAQSSNFVLDGDFTIELWIYYTDVTYGSNNIMNNRTSGGFGSGAWTLYGAAAITFENSEGIFLNTSLPASTWTHIAVVRNGSTVTLYKDGVSSSTFTSSDTLSNASNEIYIGAWPGGSDSASGYYDEVRISNTARYTSGFTPSTAPFTNDADTVLLMHMDGTDGSTDFRDDNGTGRSPVGLSAQQQVQVSTAQSKFGGASAYFDGGTDDYILVDHTQFSHAYSDNFTFECWVRLDSLPSLFTMLATGSTRGDYFSIYNKSGTWTLHGAFSNGSTVYYPIYNIGLTPSPNTWYHVAVVKDGASLKLFWDGTELTTNNGSSGTMTTDKGWNGISRIGDWAGGSNYATTGYIDEVRWSSTARYTSSFIPATEPFQNDANTLLLLHMDGTDGSTTFIDDNGSYTP